MIQQKKEKKAFEGMTEDEALEAALERAYFDSFYPALQF